MGFFLRTLTASLAVATLFAIVSCGGSGGTASGTGGGSGGSSGGSSGGTSGGGSGGGTPDLGPNANMRGYRPFPTDNPWNTRVDTLPVDPASDAIIASIGPDKPFHPDFGADLGGETFGIPYVVVSKDQLKVPMSFEYADESDPGPYPVPADAPIEGGPGSTGDRHILVIDRDSKILYETFSSYPENGGWRCGSGAKFDLNSNATRPAGWTSADAAGLPIFPGLVRYDEAAIAGKIEHALRFTVSRTRRAYIAPATHWASSRTEADLPPMGMRVRLKASFDTTSFSKTNKAILNAMKQYGMFVADNGSDWFVSGAPDSRWNDEDLNQLKQLRGSDFEVVQMGEIVTP
ncbi:MAG: hypothetical protein IT207_01345 [Fimbriimonadaceae bacterium]|nr:hypothetical protein [Fimbriimonadaceae bacterium]